MQVLSHGFPQVCPRSDPSCPFFCLSDELLFRAGRELSSVWSSRLRCCPRHFYNRPFMVTLTKALYGSFKAQSIRGPFAFFLIETATRMSIQSTSKPIRKKARSHRFALPPNRSVVIDLMHFQRKIPTVTHTKEMQLGPLAQARSAAAQRISWCLLFIKAYSQISREFVELRRTFMTFPWPHFYEHSECVANVAVKREHRGEDWLFFAPFRNPDQTPLPKLQKKLNGYCNKPVNLVFKTQFRFAHMPLVARRLLWWFRLHLSGPKRVKRLGTFGLTTLAAHGVTIVDPRAPSTSVLTYGPLHPDGHCQVSITYDHRVTDGAQIAAILTRLEEILNQEIRSELESLDESCRKSDNKAA